MAFGVFVYRSDSIYEDNPAERYQFPRQYLERAQRCIGDWIVYYEPLKVARSRGYFAVARVERIILDPAVSGMYLALIQPGTYLDFPRNVPFRQSGDLIEQGLSGRSQWAVRPLSPSDFKRITDAGLEEGLDLLPRSDFVVGVQEERDPFEPEPRKRIASLMSRPFRDRAFRRLVLRAYGERCAVTGLRLINGGGRAEVEAAHIRPVESDGPDMINNGLALSGTAHWMFDRGLVALSDRLEILVSRQANDPDSIKAMINRTGHAIIPQNPAQCPFREFLQWHRDNCFKH